MSKIIVIKTMVAQGCEYAEIAEELNVSKSTVSYWANRDPVESRALHSMSLITAKAARARSHAGKRVARSARQRLAIKLAKTMDVKDGRRRYKFSTAASIAAEMVRLGEPGVSKWTVARDLRKAGYVARVKRRVPTTAAADHDRRYAFALGGRHMNPENLIFSDEKIFTCNDTTARTAWVPEGTTPEGRQNERFACRVMVWAAIGVDYFHYKILIPAGLTANTRQIRIVTSSYYRSQLLSKIVPYLQASGKTFMQDGAKPHTCNATMQYLARKNVPVMANWPPRSPDLNPIETLWAMLQKEVAKDFPVDTVELIATCRKVFARFESEMMPTINRLVRSFPDRCRKVVANNGRFP